MEYIAPIQRLIEEFRRLPGVGQKTAARYAFEILEFSNDDAERFADAVMSIKRDVCRCPVCFGFSTSPSMCEVCADDSRDKSVICVVESPKDIMVMEKIRTYHGYYHVLGGVLSAIDNVNAKDLKIQELVDRVVNEDIKEVIIATNPTTQGDTTANYIARRLEGVDVTVSRLAYGIPVGADIEYADAVTLGRAMEGRRRF